MPQIFHPRMNTISRVTIFGAVFFLAGLFALMYLAVRSPYLTEAGMVRPQPVPFSHKHHVGDVGLDCRYCHTSVEDSSFAGIPPTATCMNCHSQLFTDSPMLQPVRDSDANGTPLEWTRVHDLPGYAYFDHSIHLHKGMGCTTCHGPVNEMPLMYQEHSLLMEWCLDCHRHPERHVRPREEVFATDWSPPANYEELAEKLIAEYGIRSETSCSTCHR